MKFGGALMSDIQGIYRVANLIEEYSCEPLVVVVSAIGKTTNNLENLFCQSQDGKACKDDFFDIKRYHLQIFNELFPDGNEELSSCLSGLFDDLWESLSEQYSSRYEAYDNIVSFGEEISSYIIYHYLKNKGITVRLINAKSLILTDSNFTDAEVNWEYTSKTISSRVAPSLDKKEVVITQGFIAADSYGKSTTLGREGSDFTAAIFGNILDADEVTIWKNVPGLMSADPARFDNSIKIDSLSYHEAIELAYYGASVIHPKTIQPLKQKKIPLYVRPYYDTSLQPTSITEDTSNDGNETSIIVKDDQVLLSISTINLSFIEEDNLKQIFEAFSNNKIHINLMQNSAVSFSVCFNRDIIKLESLLDNLKDHFSLKYNTGLQLITARHYTDEIIEDLIASRKLFLIQKSRITAQMLLK